MTIPVIDIAKIRATCKCLDATLTDAEINSAFSQAIQAVSTLTNWKRGGCTTPYKSIRSQKEIFEPVMPHAWFNYTQPYNPFFISHFPLREWIKLENKLIDKTTITAVLYILNDSGETTLNIPNSSIHYSIAENSALIDMQWLIDNDINTCIYKCQRYWVIFSYEAGYDELPDCVIESICFIYNYLNIKRLGGDCSSKNCQTLDKVKWDAYVKTISVGDISYTFDFSTDAINEGIKVLDNFQLNQIHTIDNQIIIRNTGTW